MSLPIDCWTRLCRILIWHYTILISKYAKWQLVYHTTCIKRISTSIIRILNPLEGRCFWSSKTFLRLHSLSWKWSSSISGTFIKFQENPLSSLSPWQTGQSYLHVTAVQWMLTRQELPETYSLAGFACHISCPVIIKHAHTNWHPLG